MTAMASSMRPGEMVLSRTIRSGTPPLIMNNVAPDSQAGQHNALGFGRPGFFSVSEDPSADQPREGMKMTIEAKRKIAGKMMREKRSICFDCLFWCLLSSI